MIDLHSHILRGVDDGAATLRESVEIARAAVAAGTTAIAATPHVRDDYPTTAARMRELVEELRAALEETAIPLHIHTGGELALDRLDLHDKSQLREFGLAGSSYLLLEFPYHGWPLELRQRIFEVQVEGFVPVLGHPERNAEVRAAPQRLAPLVEAGAIVQVTAASVDGRLGRSTRATALELIETGLAHLIASDAHTADVRAVGLAEAAAAVGGGQLASWLTQEVPAAIVSGAPLPPRPEAPRRRRRLPLRRR